MVSKIPVSVIQKYISCYSLNNVTRKYNNTPQLWISAHDNQLYYQKTALQPQFPLVLIDTVDTDTSDTFGPTIILPLTGRTVLKAALYANPIVAYDWDQLSNLVTTGETSSLLPFREGQGSSDSVETIFLNT